MNLTWDYECSWSVTRNEHWPGRCLAQVSIWRPGHRLTWSTAAVGPTPRVAVLKGLAEVLQQMERSGR